MKQLLIFLLFCIIGCTKMVPLVPKFYKNQIVYYEVPPFYRAVCSGKGKITDLLTIGDDIIAYEITTLEPGCPSFYMNENTIKPVN